MLTVFIRYNDYIWECGLLVKNFAFWMNTTCELTLLFYGSSFTVLRISVGPRFKIRKVGQHLLKPCLLPPVDMYLVFENFVCNRGDTILCSRLAPARIFENLSYKNQVWQTGFLACENQFWNWFLQATKNQVWNRLIIPFVKLDFSKLIF